MKKRLAGLSKVTVTSLLAASLIAPNVASAAPYDIWNGTIKVGNLKDAILNDDSALLQDILDNANTYRYELGGKTYLYSEADAIAVANPNLTPTELDNKIATDLADKAENAPEESTDLVVQSVAAITNTINVTGGKLEFSINGETTAADLSKVTEAGYTVEFKASDAVFKGAKNTSTTGELATLAAGKTFQYQVIISQDGTKVAESTLQTVTAQAQANVVTTISSIELFVTQNGVDVKVASGKLATGDTAKVVVKGKTADMQTSDADVDVTSKVTLSSNVAGILTVDNTGAITLPGLKGDVVITATAGDVTKTLSVNAGNEARAISVENTVIDTKTLQLATSGTKVVTVTAKDQYGDAMVLDANKINTEVANNASAAPIAAAVTTSVKGDTEGKHTFTLAADASNVGSGTVVVKEVDGSVTLGEIALTVKAPGEATSYKLETANGKYELDAIAPATTITLALNGYDKDGLKTGTIPFTDYTLESSNKNVATVNSSGVVTPIAAGTATITIYKTVDAFKTPIATQTVTVKDTTPAITSLELKEVATITAAGDKAFADIFTINTTDSEGVKDTATVDNTGTYDEIKVSGTKVGKVLVVAVPENANYVFTAKATANGVTIAGDGKGKVYVYVQDNAGNKVGEAVLDVDIAVADAPTVTLEESTSVSTPGNVKLKGSATIHEYRINSGNWITCTANMEVPANVGDVIEVRVKKVDGTPASASEITTLTVSANNIGGAADTTAPTISSATVNGTTLTITFDEALANSNADKTAFTVAGVTAGNDISSVSVSGTTVTIILQNAAVSSDTVTVSYTPSGTNDLADAASNKVANIVSQAVVNNTP